MTKKIRRHDAATPSLKAKRPRKLGNGTLVEVIVPSGVLPSVFLNHCCRISNTTPHYSPLTPLLHTGEILTASEMTDEPYYNINAWASKILYGLVSFPKKILPNKGFVFV